MRFRNAVAALVLTLGFALAGGTVRDWILPRFRLLLGLFPPVAFLAVWTLFRLRPNVRSRFQPSDWKVLLGTAGLTGVIVAIMAVGVQLQFHGNARVEWLHWFAFSLLGGWWFYAWWGSHRWIGSAAAALLVPLADELFQSLLPNRVGDARDVYLDAAAWMLGALWCRVLFSPPEPRSETPATLLHILSLWCIGWVLLPVGGEWLIGYAELPFPPQHPVVRIPARRAPVPLLSSQEALPPLSGLLLRRLKQHDLQKAADYIRTLPESCRPWGKAAVAYWFRGEPPLPDSLVYPSEPCRSRAYRLRILIGCAVLALWFAGFPLWLFRRSPRAPRRKS